MGTVAATDAYAFGGLFGGSSGSGHKSAGVDAIGVHVNGKDNKPNIDIRTCDSETEELVGSECCLKTLVYTDNDETKCCSTEGYAVQDGKCKKQCGEGFVLNEETNDCEDACPVERQCGDTCCGINNVCVEDENKNKWCCHKDYGGYTDLEQIEASGMCCNAAQLKGYTDTNDCCNNEAIYLSWNSEYYQETSCCASGNISQGTGEDGADECLE